MISSRIKSRSTPYSTSARFRRKFAQVDNAIGQETARDMTPQAQQAFIAIGDVTYPIPWTLSPLPPGRRPNMPGGRYSLQKAAFFATDGFGKGIPTKRTGEHTRAWEYVWKAGTGGEGTLILRNRKKASRFIFGGFQPGNGFQQRMHKPNWPSALEQAPRLHESAKRMRRQKFQEALKGFGSLVFTGRN